MKSLLPFFTLLLIITVTSCSKEKKTERVLHKVGSWEVAELDWTMVSSGVTDSTLIVGTISGSETDAGTFYFDKDGSGSYLITYNEVPKNGNFRWSVNSNGTVTIIETTSILNSIINTTMSWVNEEFSVIQEAYSFTFDQTGDKIFTGDGGGGLQVMNSGSTLIGQYAVTFDHIKLVEK